MTRPSSSWQSLLSSDSETVSLPWVGGRSIDSKDRFWKLLELPPNHGWFTFHLVGRCAKNPIATNPLPEILHYPVRGYLVGDRIVSDEARVDPDPAKISSVSERVHLIEDGLERFSRIRAGRVYKEGPLVFQQQEMPLGSEGDVLLAFLDRVPTTDTIKNITPALEAAFRMETFHREETERRRALLEAKRLEEERLQQQQEHRRQLVERLGDGEGRRAMAKANFEDAARAALRVSGAELLDHRPHNQRGEWVVRYRFNHRRLECVCDDNLRIIDAGICLTNHDTGFKGDQLFTLESLPSVVREADHEGVLVIYRHV